jgi:hypothetical protein
MLLDDTQVKLMFEDIAQRAEQLYFSNEQVNGPDVALSLNIPAV